jgi:hypothetical protein
VVVQLALVAARAREPVPVQQVQEQARVLPVRAPVWLAPVV